MIRPGRVFNGVEKVPVEWHVAGYVLGPWSLAFPAMAIAIAAVTASISPWLALGLALVPIAVWAWYIPFSNRINPDLRIGEVTALIHFLRSCARPHSSNRIVYDDD